MNITYMSIGPNCGAAEILKNNGVRTTSLPFDWILSNIPFVHDVIVALYEKSFAEAFETFYDPLNTDTYSTPKKNEAGEHIVGNYETTNTKVEGSKVYNRKYKVTFAHDVEIEEQTYRTRLERLKALLLDDNEYIRFFYANAYPELHQYTIDGDTFHNDIIDQLEKLSRYLKTKRSNFDILFINFEELTPTDDKIIKMPIFSYKESWQEIYDYRTKFPDIEFKKI